MAKQKEAWDKLSMQEKALLIKLSITNGVSSLKLIRDTYNLYANGGKKSSAVDRPRDIDEAIYISRNTPYNKNIDDVEGPGYREYMWKLAQAKSKVWGISPEEAYESFIHPSEFNYRRWYNLASQDELDNTLTNGDAHWMDVFGKTVGADTFSNESPYSGYSNPYNPKGITGGTWTGRLGIDEYIPSESQIDNDWPLNKAWFAIDRGNKYYQEKISKGEDTHEVPSIMTYNNGVMLPEITVTPRGNYIEYYPYANGGQEEILNKVNSSNANFVQRLKDPNRKNIPDWESPTDRISTHKLGVGTDENGNHYIFPEVQEINGELIDFTRPPYHRFAGEISAEMRGDTVRVPSLEDAIKFTETYKQYYPLNNGGNLVHKYDGNSDTQYLRTEQPEVVMPVTGKTADTSWYEWWFANRQKQLHQNIETVKKNDRERDFTKYFIAYPNAEEDTKRMIKALGETKEYVGNAGMMEDSIGNSLARKVLADDIADYTPNISDDNVNLYLSYIQNGVHLPVYNSILYPGRWESPSKMTVTHERAHAADAFFPRKIIKYFTTAGEVNPEKYDTWYKRIFAPLHPKYPLGIYPSSGKRDSYLDNPNEVYSRLMEFRQFVGANPNYTWTKDDLKKYEPALNKFKLRRYSDNDILKLLNEVAQNNSGFQKSENTYLAAFGGPLSHKKSTGGPLYPFSFEKNPFLKTPVVRYDEGGKKLDASNPGGYTDELLNKNYLIWKTYDPTGGLNFFNYLMSLNFGNLARGEENEYWKEYLGLNSAVPLMNPNARTEWDKQIEALKKQNGELASDFYGTTPRMDYNIQALADTLMLGNMVRNYEEYNKKYNLPDIETVTEAYELAKSILNNPNKWTLVDGEIPIGLYQYDPETSEVNPLGMLSNFGMKWVPEENALYMHDTYDFPSKVHKNTEIPVRPREMKIRSKINFDPTKGSWLLRSPVNYNTNIPVKVTK